MLPNDVRVQRSLWPSTRCSYTTTMLLLSALCSLLSAHWICARVICAHLLCAHCFFALNAVAHIVFTHFLSCALVYCAHLKLRILNLRTLFLAQGAHKCVLWNNHLADQEKLENTCSSNFSWSAKWLCSPLSIVRPSCHRRSVTQNFGRHKNKERIKHFLKKF